MNINGQNYVVVSEKEIVVNGDVRKVLKVRKPNGRRLYEVVVYANGSTSSVVPA